MIRGIVLNILKVIVIVLMLPRLFIDPLITVAHHGNRILTVVGDWTEIWKISVHGIYESHASVPKEISSTKKIPYNTGSWAESHLLNFKTMQNWRKIFHPMDVLTMEDLLLDNFPAALRMAHEGITLKFADQKVTLSKEEIKNISLFRSKRGYCIRILTEEKVYDFINAHESLLGRIRSMASQYYGITPDVVDLENFDTTHGNLIYSNSTAYLQGEKQIFSIPKSQIKKITELENELEFHLADAEIVFNTTSNISQFIGSKVSEEVCIMNGVNCINPRSKTILVFFKDYFIAKGSSYDHSVFYDDVEELFYLKRDTEHYLVLKLGTCIVQGQTKYTSLVFLLGEKEVEVAAKDPRLKPFYQGEQADVLLEIMESLIEIRAQESRTSIKCTSKVHDGHLYLLDSSMQFLLKSISIPLNEISYVEFSRVNLSLAQAKTFDMTVFADKVHNFSGIQKDAFNSLEVYFNENNIKIVSEIIDESVSEDSSSRESDSDISDLVESESA